MEAQSSFLRTKRPKSMYYIVIFLDSAIRQQRLRSWRLVLTPKNFIPSLLIVGIIFVPLGVALLLISLSVDEYEFDYTDCVKKAGANFTNSPKGNWEWRKSDDNVCEIRFAVTKDIKGPVTMYYKLYNFYQNQRMYVKSVSWSQLNGKPLRRNELKSCEPLIGPANSEKVYYPCGMIANSYFSDVFGNLEGREIYKFPPKELIWKGEKKRYSKTKYTIDQILPPPLWKNSFEFIKDGKYTEVPDFSQDERFQSWMRVSALPTFRKPYGKCNLTIKSGQYTIRIQNNYNVESFGARKSIILSNEGSLGKNSFIGYAFIISGTIFICMGILFLILNWKFPRRLGEPSLFSWNN